MARLGSMQNAAMIQSRRSFLVTMAGASLAFGFTRGAGAAIDPATADGVPPNAVGTLFEPSLWYSIDSTGTVTVNIIRAEMGQHVGTALARILADELEADWKTVRITHVDTDPKWGLMVTGGSWSVSQTWPIFSRAGAAGRLALIEAGAALLKVAPSACVARDGKVYAGTQSIAYGDIIAQGPHFRQFSPEDLDKLTLKPVSERRLIGKPVTALDIPAKTNGEAVYGIDAKVPGMVHARPKIPPTRYGSKVVSVDDSAARKVKGYLQSLVIDDPSETVPGWVLVIAESTFAAMRAADLVKVTWSAGPTAHISEKEIQDHAVEQIARRDNGVLLELGGAKGVDVAKPAFEAAASTLEQTYTTATVLHFQLEPLNALAFEKDGIFEIHTGNQWQSLILPVLAKALQRPQESIVLRSYMLGGGFGRRLNGDYAVPAALAAKALGRPVKVVLTRQDDALFDSVRSPSVQTVRMAFDAANKVTGMEHHAAAGWPTEVMAPAFMPKGQEGKPFDPFAIAGADHWYDVGPQLVRALSNDLANATFRPGWLRSVGPGWINWALESFMDEAALHVKMDPLAFRLNLLNGKGQNDNAGSAPVSVGGASRQAEVIRRAAQRAGWGQALPADTALGLATSFGQEREMPTWMACAARVHVDRKTGQVRVEKLTIVTDAGTIVDPDGARAQTEGATLWGLSMALHEGTLFEKGQVRDTNLDTYTPLRIDETPELDISFVESTEMPVGLGEPATTVIAPAIGNAIFAAVGVRLRHLPITSEAVLSGLKTLG
ncbi:xanthine dehydrogenase family protein molybdopterin-binding subunit [Beijerinckia indica]|uniref:Aldehyde oxidase and xanthine dehydrogenase molybdopterin binding n=1 Tax=Beijerinckia indica subsp. indica (strain ATCC 9039 / DSM 1715 / NCIMB 8712) TaxID=395963 RepID=B2IDZ2_BEII9|nr:molybdopterin cofactor-binding domain-containing protein [Beijerinckia indica]ACB96924.1 aldehyde oxidase and xanthine dehydrogenase molybdopterin binding [Beijerinckia indica subsp. indica ATCC 9039]